MRALELGRVHETALVDDDVELGADVTIGAYAIVHAGTTIGAGSVIGPHCVIGEPTGDYYRGGSVESCQLGERALVRSHTVIYGGVTVGPDFACGHRVTIREGSVIGEDFQAGTMSDLQGNLTIGDHVRFHSNVHIGQRSTIEDFVWIFPFVVLTNDPHPPSDTCTQGPTVRREAIIATNSVIMPALEIGEQALVGAMALVTRDVPAETVVVGVPAKPAGSIHDIRCKEGALERVYPWRERFTRGYTASAFADAEPPTP
jgi:acetyltransferase-like isoleucine patch superfamily enzyme